MTFRFGSLFCRNAYLLHKQVHLLALPHSITGNVVQMCVFVKGTGVERGRLFLVGGFYTTAD